MNIKENKDVGGGKLGEEKKKGFGYEEDQGKKIDQSAKDKKKNDASNI